jgi:sRNA-binding protein
MVDSDDDFEIVGQQGVIAMRDWPHPRDRCLEVPFGQGNNAKVCVNCWCFICETKSTECATWAAHCNATDQDPSSIVERNTVRRSRERSSRREEDQRPENVQARQNRQQEAAENAQRTEIQRAAQRARAQQGDAAGASNETPAPPEAEEEVETLFQAYTTELDFPGVHAHPTTAFETTSLSFVKLPQVDLTQLKLLDKVKAGSGDQAMGKLSSLQMETVALATARHRKELDLPDSTEKVTCGFFLGDGPGVGKGRQVAATIYENYLHGCKHHVRIASPVMRAGKPGSPGRVHRRPISLRARVCTCLRRSGSRSQTTCSTTPFAMCKTLAARCTSTASTTCRSAT